MRRVHSAGEIVAKLRLIDELSSTGRVVGNAVQAIGVTEVTFPKSPPCMSARLLARGRLHCRRSGLITAVQVAVRVEVRKAVKSHLRLRTGDTQ
jgi:hypothetical protein